MNNNFRIKIKRIFLPYVLLSLSFIIVYSLINWYFIFRSGKVFRIHEALTDFMYPYLFSLVPSLIWSLITRTKIIYSRQHYRGGWFSLFFFATLTIGIPNAIIQHYLDAATGTITQLSDINGIENKAKSKYYVLQNYYIDKHQMHNSFETSITGKGKQYFNMSIYVALPILSSQNDSLGNIRNYWFGLRYSKQINNRGLSEEERDIAFKEFGLEVQRDFDTSTFNRFVYFERWNNSSDLSKFTEGLYNTGLTPMDPSFLIGVNEPFKKRTGYQLFWALGSYGIGMLIILLLTFGFTLKK